MSCGRALAAGLGFVVGDAVAFGFERRPVAAGRGVGVCFDAGLAMWAASLEAGLDAWAASFEPPRGGPTEETSRPSALTATHTPETATAATKTHGSAQPRMDW